MVVDETVSDELKEEMRKLKEELKELKEQLRDEEESKRRSGIYIDVGERVRFFKEHNIRFDSVKPKRDVTVCIPLRQDVFIHPHVQRIPALSLS